MHGKVEKKRNLKSGKIRKRNFETKNRRKREEKEKKKRNKITQKGLTNGK
jgi:hypothetical protein